MESFLSWLVILVGVPVVFAVKVLLNGRLGYAVGWGLAQWAAAAPWRAPGLSILLGLAALGVGVWAVRLQAPILIVFFVAALLWFLVGVTAIDDGEDAGGEPRDWNQGWWRRTRP